MDTPSSPAIVRIRALCLRWPTALAVDPADELADAMRSNLAAVGREGGDQPLLAAAVVALLCEVGELARDENNGTCLCRVDVEIGTLNSRRRRGRRAMEADADRDGYAAGVSARSTAVAPGRS
jgi:hypothetical protein